MRRLLIGLAAVGLLALAGGCRSPGGATTRAGAAAAQDVAEAPAPLPYVARVTGQGDGAGAGSDEPLPLVVALHGRGSTPERFAGFFDGIDVPLRLLFIEAPVDEGDGRAWWQFRNKSAADIDAEVRALADRILATLDAFEGAHATRGRPILTGFSQGAMLVYLLALDHPARFSLAVPVAGALFDSFIPPTDRSLAGAPPFVVLHGEDDPIIPPAAGLRRLDRLVARGVDVSVKTFPGVPHWIMRDMKTALHDTLRDAAGAESRRQRR